MNRYANDSKKIKINIAVIIEYHLKRHIKNKKAV